MPMKIDHITPDQELSKTRRKCLKLSVAASAAYPKKDPFVQALGAILSVSAPSSHWPADLVPRCSFTKPVVRASRSIFEDRVTAERDKAAVHLYHNN